MDRIRVVGSSGSGKTTTATAIAARLGIPRLELDSVHWLPDWQERDVDEFRRRALEFATSHPRWVIDGNYTGRLGPTVDHLVDTFVWLDLPRWRVMAALLARTIRRSLTREQLWGTNNHERLRFLLSWDPHTNLMRWSWINHHKNRRRYGARAEAGAQHWVRLRSRREVREFLDGLVPQSESRAPLR